MAASGRVNPEILQPHRLAQEVLTGFEFSGKDLRFDCLYLWIENRRIHLQRSSDSWDNKLSRNFFRR